MPFLSVNTSVLCTSHVWLLDGWIWLRQFGIDDWECHEGQVLLDRACAPSVMDEKSHSATDVISHMLQVKAQVKPSRQVKVGEWDRGTCKESYIPVWCVHDG